VSQVTVNLVGDGTSLELQVPKVDPSQSASTVDGWKPVATADKAGATAVLKPTAAVKTRYVLVWLTRLPKEANGNGYRGEISEVSVQR
jgi:putative peptidoglycan lipid II flippase